MAWERPLNDMKGGLRDGILQKLNRFWIRMEVREKAQGAGSVSPRGRSPVGAG